jgi:hypothetical protein
MYYEKELDKVLERMIVLHVAQVLGTYVLIG